LTRLLLDAHFDPAVARALRERGYEVRAAFELRPEVYQLSDEELLAHATASDSALVTRNIRDFVWLHQAYLATDRTHAGIILVHSKTVAEGDRGAEIRALDQMLRATTHADVRDRLVWLESSRPE
jgi:predicted nuclease of predicted toxin-antitoxin system